MKPHNHAGTPGTAREGRALDGERRGESWWLRTCVGGSKHMKECLVSLVIKDCELALVTMTRHCKGRTLCQLDSCLGLVSGGGTKRGRERRHPQSCVSLQRHHDLDKGAPPQQPHPIDSFPRGPTFRHWGWIKSVP